MVRLPPRRQQTTASTHSVTHPSRHGDTGRTPPRSPPTGTGRPPLDVVGPSGGRSVGALWHLTEHPAVASIAKSDLARVVPEVEAGAVHRVREADACLRAGSSRRTGQSHSSARNAPINAASARCVLRAVTGTGQTGPR
jgi:hypothetical protein